MKNMIQKTFALSAIACAVVGSATAADIPEYNWNEGELLSYRVYMGMLKAGKATIEYKESDTDYAVTVKAKTSGLARSLFKLNDVITVTGAMDDKALFPYAPSHYNLTLSEGKYRANKDVTFNFNNETKAGTATFQNKLKEDLPPEVFDLEPQTRDVLSAMYYLRNMVNAETIQIGDVYTLPVYGTKDQYTMDVMVTGEDTLLTSFGEVTLWRVEPQNSSSNKKFSEEQSKPWGVWVTQDKHLIPVRIDVHLKIGTFKARLREVLPLKQ